MSKLPTALLRSRHHTAPIVVALALIASVFSLALDSPAEAAPGWNHEVLDTGISTGEGLSTIYWPPYLQHHVFNSGIESSVRVLRHGWYQPGFSNWAFETLDQGNSTGMATATGLWDIQHHVFNTGEESSSPVLRHGWYQPGFSKWEFETLDAGISTGTDTAYAEYSGQQHVFTHGLSPTGEDILRHGWYDPGVGSWVFETLDQGFSGGKGISTMVWRNQLHYFSWLSGTYQGLRHGWYEPSVGWKFETLVESQPATPDSSGTAAPLPMRSAAHAGPDGNQYVQFTGAYWRGFYKSPFGLTQAWYSPSSGYWSLSHSMAAGIPFADGRGSSLTTYGTHTEVFDYASNRDGGCIGLYHAFWNGRAWSTEVQSASCRSLRVAPADLATARPTASATYPPFNQLHAFYAQDPPAIGHYWYNPT